MGSSFHKNRKSSSKARRRDRRAKQKKRSLEFSSSSSDDHSSSSSDSEDDYKSRRTHSRRTKKRSRHSPTRDVRKSHRKRSRSQRHSQPLEKKKPTKRKQRNSPSSDSCSTFSNRSWSRSSNRDNVYNRSKEPDRSYHRDEKRKRSRYRSPSFHSSRSPSCNRCVSSCERPTNYVSSVVTVTKELEEVGRIESVKEETKAEVMQSYDDYPSSRSNESYEGGTKGKIKVAEPSANLVETSKGERSANNGISNSDDLESHLRQKALENFAKFRFSVLANAKSVGNEKDETVSESVQAVSCNSTAELMYKLTETNSKSVDTKKPFDTSTDHSVVMATDAKQGLTLPESGDGKLLELIAMTKNIPREKVIETSKSIPGISCMGDHKIDGSAPRVSYSCPDPEEEAHASNEVKDDNKSGSQLQEKTMSVMRGGELVQVSYKVYIPQKPRALARRQLQR